MCSELYHPKTERDGDGAGLRSNSGRRIQGIPACKCFSNDTWRRASWHLKIFTLKRIGSAPSMRCTEPPRPTSRAVSAYWPRATPYTRARRCKPVPSPPSKFPLKTGRFFLKPRVRQSTWIPMSTIPTRTWARCCSKSLRALSAWPQAPSWIATPTSSGCRVPWPT